MFTMPLTVVLCGGKGLRLRPVTETIPKPLIKVNGRPIIDYIIDGLQTFGLHDVVLLGGYRHNQLIEHFKKNSRINVLDTGDVDIARRLEAVVSLVDDYALVLYGDTLSDVNLDALRTEFEQDPSKTLVAVWPLKSSFGIFDVGPDGIVISYLEKPRLEKWINIGYLCIPKAHLLSLPKFPSFELFLRGLVELGQLRAFRHEGVHVTINTQQELQDAEQFLMRAPGEQG